MATKRKNHSRSFLFILLIAVIAVIIDFPTYAYNLTLFGKQFKGTVRGPDINFTVPLVNWKFNKELKLWEGLDLQGGVQLIYQADMKDIAAADRGTKLQEVVDKIDRRINELGVTEPLIQTSVTGDIYRVIVEIPGISDVERAKSLIGATAQLEFMEYKTSVQQVVSTNDAGEQVTTPQTVGGYVPVGLTGKDFYKATAQLDTNTSSRTYNQPIVRFEFKQEAVQGFSDLTQRLNTEGGVLAIMLDNTIIFEGRTEHITDGSGQISGIADLSAAKNLTIQLNEGALPVPIAIMSEQTISPTLGSESVHKSVVAGIIGITAVAILMVWFYHLLGVVAVFALVLYALFTIALFKLIPITLTLAGIAGYILSIGMAVDASILIFERFKEEYRSGKSLGTSIDIGFKRAWNSIRDSNAASILTCAILFYFGSGVIRGFAVTLFIGILVSLFTAIVVTRNILELILGMERFRDPRWYGLKKD